MDKVTEILVMDIESLSEKLINILPQSKGVVLAAGSLAAAAHILKTQSQGHPKQAPRALPAMPDPPLLSVFTNPGGLDIEDVRRKIAARMQPVALSEIPEAPNGDHHSGDSGEPDVGESPVKKWIKPSPRTRPAPIARPIRVVNPGFRCIQCDGPVWDHARAATVPVDSEGRAVYVLCADVKVRCVPGESQPD